VASAVRTVERGYYDNGAKRAGQVRRVHIIREEGPRGWDASDGKHQTWCGQSAWNGRNSRPIIRDAPHHLPAGLKWCPKCTGHLAEQLGRLEEVARLLGLGVLAVDRAAVVTRPDLDVLALPDLPHVEVSLRRREVTPVDDLLDTLPADAPEHAADLCGPD
jgi:hypothetical protein